MPAATAKPAFERAIGTLPTLEWIPVDQLGVDPFYQRSTDTEPSRALIRRIARAWNWDLCQPLAVSRREDGTLFVVDGQHRLTAARMRGDVPHLPCVIQRHRAVGDEAALFVALNKQRQKLTAGDLFKAALAASDGEAVEIAAAMADAGLSLAPHSNFHHWKPGMVSNIAGIQASWRRFGSIATTRAMHSIATAFRGKVLQYAGTLFGGVARFHQVRGAADDYLPAFHNLLMSKSQEKWRHLIDLQRAANNCRWDEAGWLVFEAAFAGKPLDGLTAAAAPIAVSPTPPAAPAEAPKPAAARRAMTFAEQLEAVRNGARIEEKLVLRKPDQDRTLGGVGTGML